MWGVSEVLTAAAVVPGGSVMLTAVDDVGYVAELPAGAADVVDAHGGLVFGCDVVML